MASRERGHRGRPRGTGQAPLTTNQPPTFEQWIFVEAVGVTEAAIAQARIAGSQGDRSNLQRFRMYHPPTFIGGRDQMVTDQMVTDHWFM